MPHPKVEQKGPSLPKWSTNGLMRGISPIVIEKSSKICQRSSPTHQAPPSSGALEKLLKSDGCIMTTETEISRHSDIDVLAVECLVRHIEEVALRIGCIVVYCWWHAPRGNRLNASDGL